MNNCPNIVSMQCLFQKETAEKEIDQKSLPPPLPDKQKVLQQQERKESSDLELRLEQQ